jgi:signal transduction histidine kinase
MGVISIWLGWFVAGRALQPLRTITNAAKEISATSLHRRLALAGPDDELKQLGNTFDELLGRLESAFEAQRRFVSNASHELRTPLTLERALIEVALADPHASVESLRATCEQVLAAGEQQERLIEALLTLSRSQRGLDASEPVDLRATVAAALERLEHGDLALAARLEPARTRGDERLIERLVGNLLANAVRHNRPGGRIEVRTEMQGRSAVLTIANSGRPVAPSELERIVRPFERVEHDEPEAPDGLGLGLSIVEAIATAHGATLTLRAGGDGGLEAVVAFPEAGPDEAGGVGDPAPGGV